MPGFAASQTRSGVLRPLVLTIRPSVMNRSLTSMADVQQPARIESQVEDQAAQLSRLQVLERLAQVARPYRG